ncbi:MAG: F-box protein [Verrucomicrobia bacterium]|nr:F-box protein [Verrucomicrobiota bacterium]
MIPRDVVWLILRHLPPEELPRLCAVCRVFNQVASSDLLWRSYNLREVFPNARFIGRDEWERYVHVDPSTLVQRGRPYVTKQDFKEIKQMEKQVEGKLGITIMTFFKGRTLQEARDSAGNPKEGNVTRFQFFNHDRLEQLRKVQCPETITVVIANGVFEGSKKQPVDKRKQMVRDLKCRPLTLREAVDFGLMVYRMTPGDAPVRLFGGSPDHTYTLCVDEEKDEKTGELIEIFSHYGDFEPAGPCVSNSVLFRNGGGRGVCGLRELKVLDP